MMTHLAAVVFTLSALIVGPLGARGTLPPPDGSYKVLMLLPLSTKSHRSIFMPIAEELADRGHEVTMVTNHPAVSKHIRVHEIYHQISYASDSNIDILMNIANKTFFTDNLSDVVLRLSKDFFNIPKISHLLARRQEYDVIIVSMDTNELTLPFVHEMPFMMISPSGLDPKTSAAQGNVLNPSYVFGNLLYTRQPMTFLQRAQNLLTHLAYPYIYDQMGSFHKVQDEIWQLFPGIPPLMDLKKNVSLTMFNTDHCYDTSVPLLPSQIEIGCIQCRNPKPLKEELLRWMKGAGTAGVIYFSLGTAGRSKAMPQQYRDLFVAAFAKLPQRVIWKYEPEELEGISNNVMLRKWLPQQDILAHPSVKVFISHGGLLSTQESLYHAKPLIVLPMRTDEPRNGNMIAAKDYGIALEWEELTVDLIVNSIKEIIENKRYEEMVTKVSECLHEKMETPLDRAIWWTEYVIRHKGAPALRSPANSLSWTEYLLLDFLLLLNVVFFALLWMLCKRKSNGDDYTSHKSKQE
ncbi:UDP-glycosyltransferase UGT5-like [Oratosquilla oratoria]|uniref:UDP-glycosyltransferase UGT5-like n=1 Tax=Oratosquilla oratoria TaxID=337810 RepID=UPI003F7626A7